MANDSDEPTGDDRPRKAAGEGCCTDEGGGDGTTVVRDGLILRSKDGETYFIRKEILEVARITEPEMEDFIKQEAGKQYKKDRQRFTVDLGPINKALPLTGPFDAPSEEVQRLMDLKAASTVMCPGNCRRVAYVVTDDEF